MPTWDMPYPIMDIYQKMEHLAELQDEALREGNVGEAEELQLKIDELAIQEEQSWTS